MKVKIKKSLFQSIIKQAYAEMQNQAGAPKPMGTYQDLKNLLRDYEQNRNSPFVKRALSNVVKGKPKEMSPQTVRKVIGLLHKHLDAIRQDQAQMHKLMRALELPKQEPKSDIGNSWQPQDDEEDLQSPEHERSQTQEEQKRQHLPGAEPDEADKEAEPSFFR